jgi:hypothetical protein
MGRAAVPTALESSLRKQFPPQSRSSVLPILVLRSALFAAPGWRSERAIARGVATRSPKVMLTILALRLLPAPMIVVPRLSAA